jgi:hypothetical protein
LEIETNADMFKKEKEPHRSASSKKNIDPEVETPKEAETKKKVDLPKLDVKSVSR